jgi:CheY-like chemotaxis protein
MADRHRILVVDDESSLLIALKDFLQFSGYEVLTANSGEQGLAVLREHPVDLVILDISMPGMGGIGFLGQVSDDQGLLSIPVLVLTARANMAEFFADTAIAGFIAKPSDRRELLAEVRRILAERKTSPETPPVAADSTPKRVMISENDRQMRDSLSHAFASAGFAVIPVAEGPEVLERAPADQPDVIVLKRIMLSMNGDAVAALLRSMPSTSKIPIVIRDEAASPTPEDGRAIHAKLGPRQVVAGESAVDALAAVRGLLGA